MHLRGTEYITNATTQPNFQAKMVFNEHGAIFFPVTREHRDQSGPGIQYADNYKGNALAAMIAPGTIEVRFHRDFSDQQVGEILRSITNHPSLGCLRGFKATYQGRPIPSER